MYADYFGLDEPPFAITPDPRYLYLGARHAEALAHLLYGVREGGGFILLTGEVGTGKTTLTRCLLDELPEDVDVALLLNPRLDVTEFLEAICQELGVSLPAGGGNRRLVDALNRHLLERHAEGKRTVLIVDEAQNLAIDVLEQVRLLTNLETAKTKLLQILLIGQPELRELIGRPELRQLAQRITARYHLEPLDREELPAYVTHRLGIAGAHGPIFGTGALTAVWKRSGGIPRRVNLICDRALLGAYAAEARDVTVRMVNKAAREVDGEEGRRTPRRAFVGAALLLVAAALGFAGWYRPALIAPVTADAPAAATVEAASTGPSLSEWLVRHAATAGTDSALSVLFGEWQRRYQPGGAPACDQARDAGLRCLHGEGTWRTLVGLDRPAVLELETADGARYQVAIVRAFTRPAGETALLRAGGAKMEVPAVALGTLWTGEYLALWKPPAGIDPPLLPGASGPGVRWLQERLDRLLGGPASAGEGDAVYDAALTDKVRRFQARAGLDVDGIAGERTLLALNTLLRAPNRPYLTGNAGE